MVGTDEERDPDCIERCTKVHTVDRSFPRYIDVSGLVTGAPIQEIKFPLFFFILNKKKRKKKHNKTYFLQKKSFNERVKFLENWSARK